MNVITFLTFAISCFALSGAEEWKDVEYRLALGPLEVFLNRGTKAEVLICYDKCHNDYVKEVIDFYKKIPGLKHLIKRDFGSYIHYKYYMTYAVNEMGNIAKSLIDYLTELNKKIYNWSLYEGGKVVWNQRIKLGDHYRQYLKHMNDVRNRRDLYVKFAPKPEHVFKGILRKSDEVTNGLLQCMDRNNVSLTGKKNDQKEIETNFITK